MKCPKCGCHNKFNATVCENCGLSFTDPEAVAAAEAAAAAADPFADIPEPKSPDTKSSRAERKRKTENKASEVVPEYHEDDTALEKFYYKTVARMQSYNNRVNSSLADKFEGNGEKAKQASEKVKTKYNTVRDGIKEDKKKQNKFIAGVIAVLLLLMLLIGGLYSWRNCTASCVKGGFIGTWGEINCIADGYDANDIILEFTREGKVCSGGEELGAYSYSKGMLKVSYNGVDFSGSVEAGDRQISLYMNLPDGQVSDYAGMTLYKLSSKTGLESGKLASLYPNA